MTAKKDDTCGADAGLGDDVSPMRKFGGAGPAAYTTGPSHVDRADFRDDATAGEASDTAADVPADAPTVAADTSAIDDGDTKPGV
ncbi:MAG: hypothetical protein JNK45_19005 [Myxococcales bacterium]|nr:hypothetical protein [Myxococcales bacterium]